MFVGGDVSAICLSVCLSVVLLASVDRMCVNDFCWTVVKLLLFTSNKRNIVEFIFIYKMTSCCCCLHLCKEVSGSAAWWVVTSVVKWHLDLCRNLAATTELIVRITRTRLRILAKKTNKQSHSECEFVRQTKITVAKYFNAAASPVTSRVKGPCNNHRIYVRILLALRKNVHRNAVYKTCKTQEVSITVLADEPCMHGLL